MATKYAVVQTKKDADLLKFIRETRPSYSRHWNKEIGKYQKQLLTETNSQFIKLKKEEIKRLKELIITYDKLYFLI